jgi:hypothetical protein
MSLANRSVISIAAALLLYGAMPAAAQIKLEFSQGLVNLTAENATARSILAEWARLGGTRILNGDRVAGPPLTLELVGVSERQALDVILRGVSGYMIASRQVAGAGASAFDRIMILPTSTAPRLAAAPAAAPPPVAFLPQGLPREEILDDDLDDDELDPPPPDRPFPGNARQRVARPILPLPGNPNGAPNVNGVPPNNGGLPQEDDVDEPAEPPAPPPPGNPFGVQPGSTRPGVITPAPPPTNRARPETDR